MCGTANGFSPRGLLNAVYRSDDGCETVKLVMKDYELDEDEAYLDDLEDTMCDIDEENEESDPEPDTETEAEYEEEETITDPGEGEELVVF